MTLKSASEREPIDPSEPAIKGVLIIDYGSQYTMLIARRVRERGFYSEVWPCDDERLLKHEGEALADGIILSGGPASVGAHGAPTLRGGILALGVPVLGICYGMQVMSVALGGEMDRGGATREYGRARVTVERSVGPFSSCEPGAVREVWMSHGDTLKRAPQGFEVAARTERGVIAAIVDPKRHLYGVQFHPEVSHTPQGRQMIDDFLSRCEGLEPWSVEDFLEQEIDRLRRHVGPQERVLCALSGGVDSSVVAALLHRAIGARLTCVLVDNGLMRQGEVEQVRETFEGHFGVDLRVLDASERFISALAGVKDPERKRKIIGQQFISEFERVAEQLKGATYLAQGTLYPDVIESISIRGPSATIKSHHNVGGLPEVMQLELIEPLRELFKDEVRELGRALGLPEAMIDRHPFPGPGLAIRIMGEVTAERLEVLRRADAIFIELLRRRGHYAEVWQAFAVLLPEVKTVGVMGDHRTYEGALALRAVTSTDGMTADRAALPMEFLGEVSDAIINQVQRINRVVYDVSSKPPATIEWE